MNALLSLLALALIADDATPLSVYGVVQNADGEPIEGAAFEVVADVDGDDVLENVTLDDTSDEYGRFALSVPPDAFELAVSADGFLGRVVTGAGVLKPVRDLAGREQTITLQRGVRPVLKIVDGVGEPVPGITFSQVFYKSQPKLPPRSDAVSDEDGLLTGPLMPLGIEAVFSFTGTETHVGPPISKVTIPKTVPDGPVATLVSLPSEVLTVTAEGYDGVAGVTVTAPLHTLSHEMYWVEGERRTHDFAEGPLTMAAPAGRTLLSIGRGPREWTPDWTPDPSSILAAYGAVSPVVPHGAFNLRDDLSLTLRLEPAVRVTGRLVLSDADVAKPRMRAVDIRALSDPDASGRRLLAIEGNRSGEPLVRSIPAQDMGWGSVIADDGTFEASLPPGEYVISARIDGDRIGVPLRQRITITGDEGEITLDPITTAPMPPATGRVVDAEGQPVAGAALSFGVASMPWKRTPATADPQGRFTLAGHGVEPGHDSRPESQMLEISATDPQTKRTGSYSARITDPLQFANLTVTLDD